MCGRVDRPDNRTGTRVFSRLSYPSGSRSHLPFLTWNRIPLGGLRASTLSRSSTSRASWWRLCCVRRFQIATKWYASAWGSIASRGAAQPSGSAIGRPASTGLPRRGRSSRTGGSEGRWPLRTPRAGSSLATSCRGDHPAHDADPLGQPGALVATPDSWRERPFRTASSSRAACPRWRVSARPRPGRLRSSTWSSRRTGTAVTLLGLVMVYIAATLLSLRGFALSDFVHVVFQVILDPPGAQLAEPQLGQKLLGRPGCGDLSGTHRVVGGNDRTACRRLAARHPEGRA